MPAERKYFDDYYLTRLMQEEAGITGDRWYIFEAGKPGETAWVGASQEEGVVWAQENGIRIDIIVPNTVSTYKGNSYRDMCRTALAAKDAAAGTAR